MAKTTIYLPFNIATFYIDYKFKLEAIKNFNHYERLRDEIIYFQDKCFKTGIEYEKLAGFEALHKNLEIKLLELNN
jgi:hypothetical protein